MKICILISRYFFLSLALDIEPKTLVWGHNPSHLINRIIFIILRKVLMQLLHCPGRVWTWNCPVSASQSAGTVVMNLSSWLEVSLKKKKKKLLKISQLFNNSSLIFIKDRRRKWHIYCIFNFSVLTMTFQLHTFDSKQKYLGNLSRILKVTPHISDRTFFQIQFFIVGWV